MKLRRKEFLAVLYADIFGYPLTVSEAKLWAIRQTREKFSQELFGKAAKIAPLLSKIPSIEGVFLTGSAAAKNATKNADVDLMIVTAPNTLWLMRAGVYILLKLLKQFKNPICPNIFLDTNHLEIHDKNLFTAHEILQAKCLYDRGGVAKKWLEENFWVKKYLPKAYKTKTKEMLGAPSMTSVARPQHPASFWLVQNLLLPLEFVAFILQYLYQKPKQTNEKVGWGYAFFHPDDLSQKVINKFDKRLVKYTHK